MQHKYAVWAPGAARSWLICVLAVLLAMASTSTATTELKLRERVMALEDERDALQDKYEAIVAEYKTVKGEIRESIGLQKRLDEALLEVAELQARSGDAIGLARGLEKCENARENTLVDLMLTESSLNEMIRKYRAMELELHKEDCSAIKRDLVQYRDQAEQCMTDVEGLKKANGELSKRATEQGAKLAELVDVEGELIKASAELEVVTARNQELVQNSVALKELEKAHVELQAKMKSTAAALETSKNELAATKAALNGLLDSLDSRLQFEALKEAHEKEILPFWLDSLLTRLLDRGKALHAKHVQPVYLAGIDSANEARAYVTGHIDSIIKSTSEVMQSLVHPMATRADVVFGKDVPARKLFDRVVEASSRHLVEVNAQRKRLRSLADMFQRISVRFIGSKLSVTLARISYFDDKPMDIESLSTGIFFAIIATLTLPLLFFTAKSVFNAMLYYFRTGTAIVVVPNESDTIDMIEDSIGYKFTNRDYAVQALEKSHSLHQVGLAIINLILANEIKGTDSKKEVERRSLLSCVDRIVRPGPGRKSIHVAKEQKAYMYICLLAAVFRDSDESVEKVMRVWGSNSELPTDLEPTDDRYIPTIEDDEEDEMPDIAPSGQSSCSSVSAEDADLPEGRQLDVDKRQIGGNGSSNGEAGAGHEEDVVKIADTGAVDEKNGDEGVNEKDDVHEHQETADDTDLKEPEKGEAKDGTQPQGKGKSKKGKKGVKAS